MNTLENTLSSYKSKLLQWDKFASIRKRPRRIYNSDTLGYCYPIERQPICTHPLVKLRGENVIKHILLQSAYKFMLDIAYVEVELINNTAKKIYDKTIDYNFSHALRHDMLSVIIDEAYHAYVAIDFVDQVKSKTGITPIYQHSEVELSVVLNKYLTKVPSYLQPAFEVIIICIGENTLTKELFNMTKQDNLNVFFHQIMADHMVDEGRHSGIFRYVMQKIWHVLDEKDRSIIGQLLPDLVLDYLNPTLHRRFDTELLQSLNFNSEDIDTIIADTHKNYVPEQLVTINPVAANIIDVIKLCGFFKHQPTLDAFVSANILAQ